MEIKVQKKLGNSMLEVSIEEKNDKDAIAKALIFTQPDYCPLCKGTNIVWDSNKANTAEGTFTYIKRRCLNCKATSTLGEYKAGGYFWKPWEIYEKKETKKDNQEIPIVEEEFNPDDLPF